MFMMVAVASLPERKRRRLTSTLAMKKPNVTAKILTFSVCRHEPVMSWQIRHDAERESWQTVNDAVQSFHEREQPAETGRPSASYSPRVLPVRCCSSRKRTRHRTSSISWRAAPGWADYIGNAHRNQGIEKERKSLATNR